MNLVDVVIVLCIVVAVGMAVRSIRRARSQGGCTSCPYTKGGCDGCEHRYKTHSG